MRLPIYINYDETMPALGYIELEEDRIPDEYALANVAIVPLVLFAEGEKPKVISFSIIPRILTDTKPYPELNET